MAGRYLLPWLYAEIILELLKYQVLGSLVWLRGCVCIGGSREPLSGETRLRGCSAIGRMRDSFALVSILKGPPTFLPHRHLMVGFITQVGYLGMKLTPHGTPPSPGMGLHMPAMNIPFLFNAETSELRSIRPGGGHFAD